MVDEGYSQVEIAKVFGVSRQAVSKRIRELRGKTSKAVVADKKVQKVLDNRIDAVAQLKQINSEALKLLDELEHDPNMKIKIMAEIRNQLRLQLDILATLYDMNAVRVFQDEVLKAIGEADEATKNEIIQRLNKRHSIRSTVMFR